MNLPDEVATQREYYARTASSYDEMHLQINNEHQFALAFMLGMLDHLEIRSVLDLGSGTGRVLRHLKQHRPGIHVVGVEPVKELREIGHSQGLGIEELIDGDATCLNLADRSFDLVCEFGILHHIRRPELAVAEMLRMSRKAIFISDSNNFGQGSTSTRLLKQALNRFGLWRAFDLLKTKGKGYTISEGDGLAYSYSVYNNYDQIKAQCECVHMLNTQDGHINPYASSSHMALLGRKRSSA
jgi:ubiquinone/menaquinone biosynthesis C-methylase UbiE